MSGSTARAKSRGERGSPGRVPLPMGIGAVGPWGVRKVVVAVMYRFPMSRVKLSGSPRKVRMRVRRRWS